MFIYINFSFHFFALVLDNVDFLTLLYQWTHKMGRFLNFKYHLLFRTRAVALSLVFYVSGKAVLLVF